MWATVTPIDVGGLLEKVADAYQRKLLQERSGKL